MLETDITLHLGTGEYAVPVGLSKPLNQLSISDLTDDIVNVGAIDNRVQISSIWGEGFDIPLSSEGNMLSLQSNNYTGWYLNGNNGYSCGYDNEFKNGLYIRTVFVLVNDYGGYQGSDENIFTNNDNTVRIVTDMDIKKVHLNLTLRREDNSDMDKTDSDGSYVWSRYFPIRNRKTNEGISEILTYNAAIVPAWLIVRDNTFIIWSGGLTGYYNNYGGLYTYGNGTLSNTKTFDSNHYFSAQPLFYRDSETQIVLDEHEYVYSDIENYKIHWSFYNRYPYYWTSYPRQTKIMLLNQASWAGLYFTFANETYKPIIENGVVKGYTTDLTKKSDIDNWDNISDHNIPITPIPEVDDKDDIDKVPLTLNSNGENFLHWYAVTGEKLKRILGSFNGTTVPTGFSPMEHIVGVYQFPFDMCSYCNVGEETNIVLGYGDSSETIAQSTRFDTEIKGYPLLNQGSYSVIHVGEYSIPRYHNNFLDYAPYTSISLYIPFCGNIELPPNLFIGNTLSVDLIFDIFSGECCGVVNSNVDGLVNYTYFTSVQGNLSISQPITSDNVGLQKATVIRGLFGVAGSLASAVGSGMGGGHYSAFGIARNVSSALSETVNTFVSLNGITPTAVGTSGGGRCSFYKPNTCVLYISTPVENHGNFEIFNGKSCNFTEELKNVHGFTVCDKPHIDVECTSTEKEEIKKLLENGVILP